MCGITGALALNHRAINVDCAKPMTDILAHRGPDDAGYLFYHTSCRHEREVTFSLHVTDEKFKHLAELLPTIESRAAQDELHSHDWDLFMGHRRLAILDVSSAGHQPMSELSRNIWLVFNGEVYNFQELRSELQVLGHRFRTNTDTEVIIYAYAEWGIECVHRFNGMFAFALYDNFRKKFFLVRDRYGIKPLYYSIVEASDGKRTLLFASEIKSMLEYSEFSRALDLEALLEYFTFQNIFTDKTLYKDVKLLPAGYYIELDVKNVSRQSDTQGENPGFHFVQYWDYNFAESKTCRDEREYVEELRRLFEQAVRRQLVSDVEVGSYLSGGMDSGAISCIASKRIPNLKTFTIGFDLHSASGLELGFDERGTSEYMSYLFKTEHYEMVLKSGDMERCLPRFAWHLEEPRVGQSYPNYYAAKLAGSFVKVCLSGCGGDELFGGYPWRYYRAVVNKNFEDYISKYYMFWQRLIPNSELQKVFAPIWPHVKHVRTKNIFRDVFSHKDRVPVSPEEYVNRSLYLEAKTFLHGLFVVEDKLSMAHGLETRVPFMDNDLVDFAMRMPVCLKLGNLQEVAMLDENDPAKKEKYFQKTRDGKLAMRKMLEAYIPAEISGGVKQGFSSPDASWFKGESIELVRRILLNGHARIYDVMDRQAVQGLIEQHLKGEKNRRLLIWSLLNIETWLNENL